MTLTFDWFLPTSGDGRTIVGRGHSLPLAGANGAALIAQTSRLKFLFDGEYYQVTGATVMRFGIWLHVITRDTEEQAWAVAGALLDQIDPAEVESAQKVLGATESTGQDRMHALHAGYRSSGMASDLEIYPHLWAGVGLVRGGAGTALVGSHERVADLIEEYASLGISEFILSGYPHLEEAYWFGEGVLPGLRRRGAFYPGNTPSPGTTGARRVAVGG